MNMAFHIILTFPLRGEATFGCCLGVAKAYLSITDRLSLFLPHARVRYCRNSFPRQVKTFPVVDLRSRRQAHQRLLNPETTPHRPKARTDAHSGASFT
jgi:hypothetical protein